MWQPASAGGSVSDAIVLPRYDSATLNIESPHSRDQILAAFEQQQSDSAAYWSAFDTAAFFRPIGASWSPAQAVRHLSKSTRPLVKALAFPRLLLRLMFGWPRRPSMSYDGLVERYQKALAEGGKAGRFAPSERSEENANAWRAAIMRDYTQVQIALRKAIARWPEDKLDRLLLPHPLLGKLTVREMLFFTLYHQRHHIEAVERRLNENAERS